MYNAQYQREHKAKEIALWQGYDFHGNGVPPGKYAYDHGCRCKLCCLCRLFRERVMRMRREIGDHFRPYTKAKHDTSSVSTV